MTFSVDHVYLDLVELHLSCHGLFHPVALHRKLVSLTFDLNILPFLPVLISHCHEFSVVVDLLEMLLS